MPCAKCQTGSMALSPLHSSIVRMLRRSAAPLSGRQVANVVNVAPNTALKALKSLQVGGLVESRREGRATLWTTTAEVSLLPELSGPTQTRVALVVTAVELEHTEIRNRLINTERLRVEDIWMMRGEIPGDHINWTVFLARAGMGNATSAALVGLAARNLEANLVAFVGSAGGLKPNDQRHFDVVVASRIHNPYAGKQVPADAESKLLGRDKTYVVPAPLVAVVNACIEDCEWTTSTRSQHYNANHPHAFVAPIVSVDAVQADTRGPVLLEILNRFQDAAALDMESFGLAAGADIHDLPVLAVRGISDFLGDKAKDGNDGLQPTAAGNAAALLRAILAFAHPDDFKRGLRTSEPPAPNTGDRNDVTPLPGAVQLWMSRLEQCSAARANDARQAITEMRLAGVSPATWLNRSLHRPPAWLREDDSGDGWALMSSLAAIAGSKVSWRGFERAAAAAELTGDHDAGAYFSLISRLEFITKDSDYVSADDPPLSGFDGLVGSVDSRFSMVVAFYRAVLEQDLAMAKRCAEVVITSLGLSDPSKVLRAPDDPPDVVSLDPALRDLVAATVLRQLAHMMLTPGAADSLGVRSGLAAHDKRGNPVTRDLADDGLLLAQWALRLRPAAEGTRLTYAQALLAVLVSMAGRNAADVEDEVSRRARTVESEALMVRDVYTEWNGSTGEALAVAARARTVQGDFVGALRMLLPAPDGVATHAEAKHPEVVRLAAFIARVTGKTELALELAERVPDRVEGELLRAAVLSGRPQMAGEAKMALFSALHAAKDRHHATFQALMALARLFNSLSASEQAEVTQEIEDLGRRDGDLADVLSARVLLSQGKGEEALRRVRALEQNELVLDAHSDALVATGRPADAARLVFSEGLRRGDIPLATEALEIAMDNGVLDVASEIALTLLGREDGEPVRLKALRALQSIAAADGRWAEMVIRTQEVIVQAEREGMPVPEIESWRLAEALFRCEKFDKALQVLLDATAISFSEPAKAQLFLAILQNAVHERRSGAGSSANSPDLSHPRLYSMFMRAAADWAEDEQIAAAAMSLVLTTPDANFNEAQIDAFRKYSEEYFERHGENASIKQIRVEDEDLEPLFEVLREGQDRQRKLEEITQLVRNGQFPLAVLTGAAGRTTTESLIRRDLGYIMAVDEHDGLGLQTARDALGGRTVVDSTALVVGPWTGFPFRKLASYFEKVLIPGPLREDVARARSSLAMRSTLSVSWNAQEGRPSVNETSDEDAHRFAEAAEQVWLDQRGLQVEGLDDTTRKEQWLSAIIVAQKLGLSVWADDIVLRRFARAMGVPAFGSLDLVRAFGTDDDVVAAVESLRANRVVDLPIRAPWHIQAQQADWDIHSPFALAISRAAAWSNPPSAFDQFRSLVRMRPPTMGPEQLAHWAHRAATGLAAAAVPPSRPAVVSGLLAWVILVADPFFTVAQRGVDAVTSDGVPEDAARLTELIIRVADDIRDRYYETGDSLTPLVDVLCEGFIEQVGPQATGRIIAALVERLDRDIGRRVFAAFIQSAGR